MNKENGGPAFPCQYQGDTRSDMSGLSMRDYFAAKAMHGMLAGMAGDDFINRMYAGSLIAYDIADAMLEARK